jgi:hypothetical protein
VAHSSNEYMQKYLKTQRDKARAFDDAMSLMVDFLKDGLEKGYSREQAEMQFWQSVTPPEAYNQDETLQPEETQPCKTSTESVSKKPECDCFGKKQFNYDCDCSSERKTECHNAWNVESAKPQAQKDAERNAKIYALIQTNKDILRKSELQDLIEIGGIIQAQKDAEQKEIDALVQKYVDRGIPEKAALESATWERKQIQNAAARQRMKAQHDWDLKSKEEQMEYTRKVIEDNKKVLRGEKI